MPDGARTSVLSSYPPEAPGLPAAAVPAAPGALGGWRPWTGRPRARDLACCLMIGISAVYAMVMIPLTPAFIASRPMLLEALSGSNSSIVAAGAFSAVHGKLRLLEVVAAALPGMLRFDWVIWWAGRLWGRSVVEKLGNYSERTAALVATAERQGTRFAKPAVVLSALMPVSGAPVYAAAGWVGLPLATFVILDAIGCATWAAVLATCGYLLGSRGVELADLVARYAIVSIALLVAAAVAPHLWHACRSRRGSRAPIEPAPVILAAPPGLHDHVDFPVNATEPSV
jgi:membrane protein DedA with SNARE-associated domain